MFFNIKGNTGSVTNNGKQQFNTGIKIRLTFNYFLNPKITIMPGGSKSGSQGGGRSNSGGKSQKGLASASKQTREEVSKKGGEASRGGGRSSSGR